MGRSLILVFCGFLSSCAYYSPFIDPTQDKQNPLGARDFSVKKQQELTDEANALSNANLYATTALAGTLGFGAYKVLTGGAPHQIAALATGSGAIYGFQQALYNESVASILLNGAATLACIDTAYTMPGADRGRKAMARLENISPTVATYIRPAFEEALNKINANEIHYTSNVSRVVTTTNIRRSNLQLSPKQTYDLLSSSLAATKPVPAPSTQTLSAQANAAATQLRLLGNKTVSTTDQQKQAEILANLITIKEWIDDINAAAANFNPSELEKCRSTNKPPTLYGVAPGTVQGIKQAETLTLKIENSSGNLNASSSAKDSNGARFVETRITTENGNYFLEVTGKVKTTTPVSVFVSDEEKEGATTVLQVTVI
jgi:hypothetical protein